MCTKQRHLLNAIKNSQIEYSGLVKHSDFASHLRVVCGEVSSSSPNAFSYKIALEESRIGIGTVL